MSGWSRMLLVVATQHTSAAAHSSLHAVHVCFVCVQVEELDEVERAFVHVDYMKRDGLEHKVERELALAAGQRSQSLGSNGRPSKQGSCSSGTSDDGGAWRAGQAAERTVESLV